MYELVDEPKNKPTIFFIDEDLPVKIIMDCRTTEARKVRTRLGFK